jgi:hypothetical protein
VSGTAKTWGPFTGRQLTTIICVLLVTILFPVGAWAVTSTNVFIGDPHNSNHAAVGSDGSLQTHINGGAPGNLAATSQFVETATQGIAISQTKIYAPPAGKELILTDLHFDWFAVVAADDPFVYVQVGDATCSTVTPSTRQVFDFATGQDHEQVGFTPGFVVPAGKSLCMLRGGTSTGALEASVFGYLVPAGSVGIPSATAAVASPHGGT